MSWERVVLVLSLAGNAVLGHALFFKSALNEMLSHWYKERVRRKGRSHEILRELAHRMTAIQRSYFLVLSECIIWRVRMLIGH